MLLLGVLTSLGMTLPTPSRPSVQLVPQPVNLVTGRVTLATSVPQNRRARATMLQEWATERTKSQSDLAAHTTAKASRARAPCMGLFDSLKKAFDNEEFKESDQRVRASHILCKGDDDVEQITELLGEIGQRVQSEGTERLGAIFADVARRKSTCSSASMGGDLGTFGPGKMVQEFDEVLFPADEAEAPLAGAVLGPVVTEFGCHLILVTKREQSREQIEEKLARND